MDQRLIRSLWLWEQRSLNCPAALAAFSLLAMVAYLPLLGYLPLHLEEPRRALIAAQMLATGDYLKPVYEDQVYLGKPPLFNWLICLASWNGGKVTAYSARLPSALSLWLLTIFLVGSAWRHIGTQAALFWGCALLLSPEILAKGQLAEIDIVFTCLVSAAIWTWWLLDQSKWGGLSLWLPPLLLTVLAYLTKREPALIFFYLSVGSYLLLQGRGRELLSTAHLGAVVLALLPVIAWFAALATQVGWPALWQSLVYEVLLRGEGVTWGRYLKHLLMYPLQILGACAPFSLLLLPLITAEFRHAVWTRNQAATQFAAAAVLANFPLYWLKGNLAVRYFLPMFPFLLLLAALSYATLVNTPKPLRKPWKHQLLPIMLSLMLLLRGLEFMVYLPLKFSHLAQTQNAQSIIADILQRLPPHQHLFVSQRIPAAIWFYAPHGTLHMLTDNSTIPNSGDLILRHSDSKALNLSSIEIATYRYENDDLHLAVITIAPGPLHND